jgi:hypothetical protein
MEVSLQLHALTALPPVKSPRYPLNKRLSGFGGWSGCCEEEKNLLPLPGIEPHVSGPSLCGLSYIYTYFYFIFKHKLLSLLCRNY